jgi:hypothetical protein
MEHLYLLLGGAPFICALSPGTSVHDTQFELNLSQQVRVARKGAHDLKSSAKIVAVFMIQRLRTYWYMYDRQIIMWDIVVSINKCVTNLCFINSFSAPVIFISSKMP